MKFAWSFIGFVAVCAAICIVFSLAGCTTPAQPQIVTKQVNVAVPVPCTFDPGPRPELMTKDQLKAAIAATPVFDDRIKILTDQVLLYMGWVPVLEAGIKGCKGVPSTAQNNAGN